MDAYWKILAFKFTGEAGVFKVTPAAQEELNMEKDTGWKTYFSDKKRYADIINGIGCAGTQIVKSTDLTEDDGQARNGRARDLLRRSAFGVNFALIGIENQEAMDYELPLRTMNYDMAVYEKQALKIRKEIRQRNRQREKLTAGEYLCWRRLLVVCLQTIGQRN